MNYLEIISPIKKELESVETIIGKYLKSEFKAIDDLSEYIFSTRGKLIRPALLLLSCALFSRVNSRAIKTAAAVELVHSATLVHDDIIDNAAIRRGKPSFNKKFGNTAAVLFGDYLYCQAFEIISKFGEKYIAENLLFAARSMCEGEIFQNIVNYNPDIGFNEYIKIIESKTARFISKCAELGAYCAKASPADVENIRKFGLNMGIAFQIADDVLDVSSDDKTIGKPAAKDLPEGKITLPLMLLFDKLDPKISAGIIKKIKSAKNKKMDPGFVSKLMSLCRQHGTPALSMGIAQKYTARAISYLNKAGGDKKIKEAMKAFCEFMTSRNS
ncbi:MAG TPA: polyprenyl synthetase family protein [Candidatus Wallbacteria bacterium]|nr:polyprenyl synthetase family protein [Candidatus Wallbacteria bacterium]